MDGNEARTRLGTRRGRPPAAGRGGVTTLSTAGPKHRERGASAGLQATSRPADSGGMQAGPIPQAAPPGPAPSTPEKRFDPGSRPTLSIRWIVALVAAGLTAAAVFIVAAVGESNARKALTREVETQLLLQARNLALASADALLTDFPELVLHPLAKEMKAKQPELVMVQVVNHEGTIQGHPDARRLGTKYVAEPKQVPQPTQRELGPGEAMVGDAEVMLASAPVRHRNGQQIGTAWVGLKRSYLEHALAEARRQQVMVLAVVLVLGVLTALVLMSFVLRPVAALRAGIERIGRGDLATPLRLQDRTELGLLGNMMDDMAAELSRMQSEMVERERLAHEVELAREIQSSLLPSKPTTSGPFVVRGSQWAAAEVGGDYYDYFVLPDGKIGVAVADVAGKGLAGCLVMSMLSALLRAYRNTHVSPARMLAVLDERLGETLKRGSFVTMFYGVLDPEAGELVYASAGHSPLLIFRRATETVEWHPTKGIPLGAIRGGAIARTLRDTVVQIAPGDLLVQYTDGINEAFDPHQTEQYGFERMERAVISAAPAGCEAVIATLREGVQRWTQNGPLMDDETILVVSREGAESANRPSLNVTSAADRAKPAATASPVDESPLGRLAYARAHGSRLILPASLEALFQIRDWLADLHPRESLGIGQFELLSTALYEACANVVEHGGGENAGQPFELWWAPGSDAGAADLEHGYFLIRDQGVPFNAKNWEATNFSDPAVWKRGRGFGLDIIHRVMNRVEYHPGTPQGNLTLLVFVPTEHLPEATPHA